MFCVITVSIIISMAAPEYPVSDETRKLLNG